MFRNRFKTKNFVLSRNATDNDIIDMPCVNLGTKIANQMYSGVDQSKSTLLSGQYDSEDSFDVDPACDFKTDRFGFSISEPIPNDDPSPSE